MRAALMTDALVPMAIEINIYDCCAKTNYRQFPSIVDAKNKQQQNNCNNSSLLVAVDSITQCECLKCLLEMQFDAV